MRDDAKVKVPSLRKALQEEVQLWPAIATKAMMCSGARGPAGEKELVVTYSTTKDEGYMLALLLQDFKNGLTHGATASGYRNIHHDV
jgi:hypothetical protein